MNTTFTKWYTDICGRELLCNREFQDGEDESSPRLPASPLCSLDSAQAKKKTAKDDSSDSDEEMKMVGLEKEDLLLTKPVAEPARGEPSAFMKLMTLVTLTWCDLVQ